MKYEEIHGDLFTAKDSVLAHCISADYALAAGIAVLFDKAYDMKAKLAKTGDHRYPVTLKVDNAYNLVTKERSFHKPTYLNLAYALKDLKDQMLTAGEKKLAIPKIGCGIDGLDWVVVSYMVKGVFAETDIEVTVYVWP